MKPDAILRGLVGKIITRFEDKELYIERIAVRRKSAAWCRAHYANLPDHIYERVQDFMLTGELIGMVFGGERTHETARSLVGGTDGVKASPGTIRGDFGTSPIMRNVIHVSDSRADSGRESQLFFDKETG
jgi:nucleoside-diphosphate kinase